MTDATLVIIWSKMHQKNNEKAKGVELFRSYLRTTPHDKYKH